MIYGGRVSGEGEEVRGNELYIEGTEIKVKGVKNFEKYKFCSKGGVMGNVKTEDVVDLSRSEVDIEFEGGDWIPVGDKYKLIERYERSGRVCRRRYTGRNTRDVVEAQVWSGSKGRKFRGTNSRDRSKSQGKDIDAEHGRAYRICK